MTTSRTSQKKTKKPSSSSSPQKPYRISFREPRLRLPLSDIFVDGKRLTTGPTLHELLAKRRERK